LHYKRCIKTPCFDTVIISDLHLGSEVSRAKAALSMLKQASFRRLILLRDMFCDLNFRRVKKEHWQFLSYIRKLSNPKRNIEVVWVEGNHDHGLSEIMSLRGNVITTNRRFRKMGRLRLARLFLNTALHTGNPDFFLRDHGYWDPELDEAAVTQSAKSIA